MSNFVDIKLEALDQSVFHMIGKEWMLVTATADDTSNTMTASWGGLGVLWNRNVAYVFIRPTRFTKHLVDLADTFSLTFFDETHRKTLNYLGTASGRDENKIEKSGLTLIHEEETPYFEEAKLVLICRKLYAQELEAECFIDTALIEKLYPLRDYHTMYVVEITKAMIKA
jgi:flavin reductase (DIM6/NTAB) family NADH-FMN oxidoreductase RutF